MATIRTKVFCPYCGKPAKLASGRDVYPNRRELWSKLFYLCKPCGAYVGCHRRTDKPLGRLANLELRRAKMGAHAAFDPLWQGGSMTRSEAYAWLARKLNITEDECHIGMFDVKTCRHAIAVCKSHRAKASAKEQA